MRVDLKDEIVENMNDMAGSLAMWRVKINALYEKYGPTAILATDGGHNNVEFRLYHELTQEEIDKVLAEREKPKRDRATSKDVSPKKRKKGSSW